MANDLEVGFCGKPVINTSLPDLSQLDESTCPHLVCQHPQCWETVRRLSKGHPRILQPVSSPSRKSEDELPTLKIIDLSFPDSSILPKRTNYSDPLFSKHPNSLIEEMDVKSSLEESHSSGFRSLRAFCEQSYAQKPQKSVRLPVQNLNATHLPKYPCGRNLLMVWIPEKQVKHKKPDQKDLHRLNPDKELFVPLKISKIMPCQEEMNKRAILKKKESTQVPTGGQPCYTQLIHQWLKVSPSPGSLTSQLESFPSWDFIFPQHSSMSSLSDEEKTISSMDYLDMLREDSLSQKGFRSSKKKMIMSVQRINLQSPVMSYPSNKRMARTTPKLITGLKIPLQKIDKAYRKPSLSKSEIPQTSEMGLREVSKKNREVLELHQVSISGSLFSQIDNKEKQEGSSEEEDNIPIQTQMWEFEAQKVKPEETSKAPLAVNEKKLKEEHLRLIQIEEEDNIPIQTQMREFEAQKVKLEETSKATLAVNEKKLKEEHLRLIQIPQASDEEEEKDEPLTPSSSLE
ncbi:uncharacterized protein C9orf43 homolog isoform X2 [Macrotis lagotis]|uniref:uncharacterized protein C9orf43 homolog isoform X2 n=1 Tax=Macrotis lagotis TaxID=92651 RepID=UPI003D689CEE